MSTLPGFAPQPPSDDRPARPATGRIHEGGRDWCAGIAARSAHRKDQNRRTLWSDLRWIVRRAIQRIMK